MSNSATPALDAQGMLRSTIASQPEGLLTINEVAAWLGVSKAWVYDHATRKKPFLPCVRFGELTRIPLGLKSEMDRGEAKAKLREIIARETKDILPAPVSVSLRWFYEIRFLPQKEQQWKVTSRPKTKRFIENYLLKRFGDTLLGDLDKFTLQTYLNEMAPQYSKSVLSKIRVYFNSMLDEAVELEMLPKNPAGKLAVPKSGKRRATKHLTPEEIPQILFHLSDRDRLIVRMFLVLGLRPGEMFALRWNDKQGNSLRIDSSITDGMEVETKPKAAIPSFGFQHPSTRSW